MLKIKTKRVILTVAATGLLIFLHFIGILRPLEVTLYKILNPFMGGVYNISSYVRNKYAEQTSKIDLWEKVKQLETQVSQLTIKNAEISSLETENQILRGYLNFLTAKKFNYIISNVISRGDITDDSERTETVIIDKGAREGLSAGMAIVSSEGLIVGKIYETKDDISKVILTNNSECRLAAAILNQEKTSGIAEGELGLTIKMNFIPQTAEIKNGDIIVTSGLEKSIPRGLVIGKVINVNKESNELWQTATIEPMYNPDGLIIVSVLRP